MLGRVYNNTTCSIYNYFARNLQSHFKNNISPSNNILNYERIITYKLGIINQIKVRKFTLNNRNFVFKSVTEDDDSNSDEPIINKLSENDLYPLSKDETIISIKQLANLNEILQHFENLKDQYNAQTFTQACQKIWLCQQMFPIQNIESSDKLKVFLEHMNEHITDMNRDEKVNCFFYLTKLGIGSHNSVMGNLLSNLCDILNAENEEIPLSTLSKFSYTISNRKEFCDAPVCNKILLHTAKYFKTCNNPSELYLITTCLHNIIWFVNNDILEEYKQKVKLIINSSNDLKNNSVKIQHVLKIITFLRFPKFSNTTMDLSREGLLLLSDKIESMDLTELEITFKLFRNIHEPAEILPKLLKTALKVSNPSINLLTSICSYNQTDRKRLIEQGKQVIENEVSQDVNNSKMLSQTYMLLRSLKINDLNLCNSYWSKLLQEMKINSEETIDIRLAQNCFRYMFFNNNLGGTFRHVEFENVLGELAMEIILQNKKEVTPAIFATLASFIIAYGIRDKRGLSQIPDIIISKLGEMKDEFEISDCLQLSKGFQIASHLRFKHKISLEAVSKVNLIENVLQSCITRYLKTEEINFDQANSIIKTLNNIKVKNTSDIFVKALELYKNTPTNLNSRSVREVMYNLLASNCLVSDIMNHIFNYIQENKNYILGDTVEKVLHTAYTLAYIPEENEEALYWSGEIIKRDFDYMSTVSIVHACLALCFFRALPLELVKKVFTPEFIKRIEDEIEICYSKQTYPDRILNQMMQLNRAVCLDYPEIQMPWFQQNYIEAQISKYPIVQSKLSAEIENVLFSVIKDKECILRNQTTPYGYTIDFIVQLDHKHKFLSSEFSHLNNISKFAILLLKGNAYCENENSNIKGFQHMRIRHLEMLGFNVIHINVADWNALHMNIPGAKTMFLKNLLKLM